MVSKLDPPRKSFLYLDKIIKSVSFADGLAES